MNFLFNRFNSGSFYHNNVTNLIHFHFHFHFHKHFIVRALLAVGWLQVQLATSQQLKCTQLTPKTASVVPPKDGHLTPETCRELRHNKVFVEMKVKVKVY
jgi:hypothetical protein